MKQVAFKSRRAKPAGKKSGQKSASAPARPSVDFWSPKRDDMLRDTGGRYSAVAELADEWGVGSTFLMARWHKIRGRK
jgi:hypothetical protein